MFWRWKTKKAEEKDLNKEGIVCVCVQWILNKDTLKGKHTPAVLICLVSVFRCHSLLSHLLFSLPPLICLYSTHPAPSRLPPSLFLPSLALRIRHTFIAISHSRVVVFFSSSPLLIETLWASPDWLSPNRTGEICVVSTELVSAGRHRGPPLPQTVAFDLRPQR